MTDPCGGGNESRLGRVSDGMTTLRSTLLIPLLALASAAAPAGETIPVFERAELHCMEDQPQWVEDDGYVIRHTTQYVTRTLDLPRIPADQRDARRIIARVRVEPIVSDDEAGLRPNDPWTRLGSVAVIRPRKPGGEEAEAEIMRFVTGYGAEGTFEQDVTALAPLLDGHTTLRGFISTYGERPGWRLSFELEYRNDGAGQRRPTFAQTLFNDPHVTAEEPRCGGRVLIPNGVERPRLRILATGHATDGLAENEFLTCPHILRVDGVEVARWRPWSEKGAVLREKNPWAGRTEVAGREIWASDLDRSGWNPGLVVEPLIIPAPELTPGSHLVEIEVEGIRPKGPAGEDGKQHHGYFAISAFVVADEVWPEEDRSDE